MYIFIKTSFYDLRNRDFYILYDKDLPTNDFLIKSYVYNFKINQWGNDHVNFTFYKGIHINDYVKQVLNNE